MPYLAEAIANSFLDIAKEAKSAVDPMKLQKLVYFSHGWHLGFKKEALSAENVQAWRWGPVFPELYHAIKAWGNRPVMRPIRVFDGFDEGRLDLIAPRVSADDEFAQTLLRRVWEVYGHRSGLDLSRLTHTRDGPWYRVWKQSGGARDVEIPNPLLAEYFGQLLEANAQA